MELAKAFDDGIVYAMSKRNDEANRSRKIRTDRN
jgi:hypothetical protein